MKITHDFETRSEVDIRTAGPWKYAEHPSTQVICLWVKVDDHSTSLWVPAWVREIVPEINPQDINLTALLAWDRTITWEAHNAEFERAIWHHVMPRYGFKGPQLEQFDCTAARAAVHGLPRSLEKAGAALGLPIQKDQAGHRLMLKLCKPRKPRKAEREADPDWQSKTYWHEDPAEFRRLLEYGRQDVEAEHALSKALRPLSASEREVWLLDQKINQRGLAVDVASAAAIVETLAQYEAELLNEMELLTGGAVKSPRQVMALRDWLRDRGVVSDNLQKATVSELLASGMPAEARRVLEIRQALGKSSTGKFSSMIDRAQGDGRCRSLLMYHGAGTGRWTAKSIQPQNMPRDSYTDDDLVQVLSLFANHDHTGIMNTFADPFFAASRCVRGCITAGPGNELIAADFSSIEARALAWLAGQDNILEEFIAERDLYKVAAVDIFGVDYPLIDKDQRAVGKVSELALGYGGGIGAYSTMARGYGVDLEALPAIIFPPGHIESLDRQFAGWRHTGDDAWELPREVANAKTFLSRNPSSMSIEAAMACDLIKQRWRAKRPGIVQLWKGLGEAAAGAVEQPGMVFRYNGIAYVTWADVYGNPYLLCRLPSGRILYYFGPEIRNAETPWGSTRPVLTHMTVDGVTKQWVRRKALGALLTENVVQALCRDLMAEAQPRLEAAGYPVVLHVHDEVVSEVPVGFGSVEEYEQIMAVVPQWAAGLPVQAKGWRGRRFRKD